MTTYLSNAAVSSPDGLTLALVSISVVFCALLLLWGIYSLSGRIFTRLEECSSGAAGTSPLASGNGGPCGDSYESSESAGGSPRRGFTPPRNDEVAAAIGIALQRYMAENLHDAESYIITVRHDVYERI